MAFRVLSVQLDPDDTQLIGRHLDLPVAGSEFGGEALQIMGWVIGRASRVKNVEVVAGGRVWQRLVLDQARPDLATAFPDAPAAGQAGFRTTIGLRGMTRADLQLNAWLEDGSRVRLGTVIAARSGPGASPPVGPPGTVDLGDLRRSEPVSHDWGFDRGVPVDRRYIESFLERFRADIGGRCLEIETDAYLRRFGDDRLTKVDVLDVDPDNRDATIVADLAAADHVPSASFDTIVLTQTLQLIYDLRAAVGHLHRILAPGGTILATAPGITAIDKEAWSDIWAWSFTAYSMRRLFEECFDPAQVHVEVFGNVLAATAFVHGLSVGDLTMEELDVVDTHYPVIVAVRARKPPDPKAGGESEPGSTLVPAPGLVPPVRKSRRG